jgi:hypothetical protein
LVAAPTHFAAWAFERSAQQLVLEVARRKKRTLALRPIKASEFDALRASGDLPVADLTADDWGTMRAPSRL